MAFRFSDEQAAIRQAVREFGQNEITPRGREYDTEGKYPRDLLTEAAKFDLAGPGIPEAYGGPGMDMIERLIVTEELWRADPGVGGAISAADFGTELLLSDGDEWMKERWLPRISAGETPIATAISESAHGSNVAGIETQAERDDDGWRIDGSKMWITNGTAADVCIVFAKTDVNARHEGLSAFLVPTDVDGFSTEKIDNKLGIRASDTAELRLEDVRVPHENLIGVENEGFYLLLEFFKGARVNVAAQSVGIAQAALDAALEYAGEREQFGQPIGEFQAIQHKLAEMATKTEAARSMTYRAASMVASEAAEATQFSSMAKLFASERAVEVTDEAIQIHGGAGYVSDFPVERYYRDARIMPIWDGTSEIQKNVIAKELL